MPPACLLTATPDEAALLVALALPTALDRLRLALVCRRYGGWRSLAATAGAADADGWSVAEESARQWLWDECSAQERGWALREGGASWLGVMWRVQRLRRPLSFTSIGTGLELNEEGALLPRLLTLALWPPFLAQRTLSEEGALLPAVAALLRRSA
jgi:hypothetical protein